MPIAAFNTLIPPINQFHPIGLEALLLLAYAFFTQTLAYCVAPPRSPR